MALFSERYDYINPTDIIIRGRITPDIQNAICSCFDALPDIFYKTCVADDMEYDRMERYLWTRFLNKRESKFPLDFFSDQLVAVPFIEDAAQSWHRKLDMVECTICYLYEWDNKHPNSAYHVSSLFIDRLNAEFKRLNFGYRIVNREIVEITSNEEIIAIETAIQQSKSNIKVHLSRALELYAQRPVGDYRNSIKESISAVEAFCRAQTGDNNWGKALTNLQSKGIVIPSVLKGAFDKLYAYTNQPDTGIRHALMGTDGTYTPAAEEALFMLVSCSAFLNYLQSKMKK